MTLPEYIDEGLQPPQLDQLGRILANEVAEATGFKSTRVKGI